MYVPKIFQNNEPSQIRDFIRQNGFAILISNGDGSLIATHIPLMLNDDGTKLSGHVSRANPQWKKINPDKEVLAIFPGPHAYISSSWYDHENVPTWNYIAVHVYGKIRFIEGEELVSSLSHLVNKYEKNSERPVSVEKMSPDYFAKHLAGLVGFEIVINRTEAAHKLSQNRDKVNHNAITDQLEKRNYGGDAEIAAAMKQDKPLFQDKS
jgi:transcriptional regulator